LGAEGWEPTIEAVGSTTITYWADRVQVFQAFEQPDIVVIELGTNDCSNVGCVPLGPYIDQIMSSIPSSNAVLWLNVQEDVPPPFDADRDFVNGALAEADQRWPNMYLIDLNGHFAAHPEWHNPDGVHFNDLGQQEFGRFLADALESFKPE
jgi:lysophospholipase L1-like esterase